MKTETKNGFLLLYTHPNDTVPEVNHGSDVDSHALELVRVLLAYPEVVVVVVVSKLSQIADMHIGLL